MNIRLQRLYNDHEEIKDLPRLTAGRVQFVTEGDPPTRYVVTYDIKGAVKRPDGKIGVEERFEVEFILPDEYPRLAPIVTTRQLIWHPNFWMNHKACVDAEHFAAGQSLADLIIRVGEMIQYQRMNLADPANVEAVRWAQDNKKRLPLDPSVLQCGVPRADPGAEDDGPVVAFGGISREDEDDDEVIVSMGDLVREEPPSGHDSP